MLQSKIVIKSFISDNHSIDRRKYKGLNNFLYWQHDSRTISI